MLIKTVLASFAFAAVASTSSALPATLDCGHPGFGGQQTKESYTLELSGYDVFIHVAESDGSSAKIQMRPFFTPGLVTFFSTDPKRVNFLVIQNDSGYHLAYSPDVGSYWGSACVAKGAK